MSVPQQVQVTIPAGWTSSQSGTVTTLTSPTGEVVTVGTIQQVQVTTA